MKLSLWLGIVVLVLVVVYGLVIYNRLSISKELVAQAKPFQVDRRDQTTSTTSVLVLGDSTGVGVGADKPENSLAGLLGARTEAATVENYSVSGAVVADLPAQVKQAKLKEYSIILIQIGANDIIRFHGPEKTAARLDAVLATLPKAHRVAVMSAGNVGEAPAIPIFLRGTYGWLNQRYHVEFAKVVKARKFIYVNLYRPPSEDLFHLRPDLYFARDDFHPSSLGYGLWFQDLMESF